MKKTFLVWTLFFLVIDLATKIWAGATLKLGAKQETLISGLSWRLIYNEGMTFSFLEGYPRLVLILNLIAMSFVIFVLILYRSNSKVFFIASTLIIGGGLGNLFNRLYSGHVVDFINVQGYPAIFNMADIEIRLGMILIIIFMVREYILEKQKSKAEKA